MRIRYLRIALLAGILAATAPVDSTRTNLRSATSREELSPPSDRDDVAAIMPSVGHEDRASQAQSRMTVIRFVEEVLLSDYKNRRKAVEGFSKNYAAMVKKQIVPQQLYQSMVVESTRKPLLTTESWRKWAFLASKYCAKEGKDPHEYIAEVMLHHYGAFRFSEILAAAADRRSTMRLVVKLQEVQIPLWLQHQYQPHQVFNLLRVEDVWKKNVLASPQFIIWTRYLKRLREAEYVNDPIGTEVRSLCKFLAYDRLLKMLMLPENTVNIRGAPYLQALIPIMVNDVVFPSDVLSMLLEGVKRGNDQFTLLLIYGPASNFWMTYFETFNEQYSLHNAYLFKTLTSVFEVPELLTMLHAALIAPDDYKSGMALLYLEKQFSEWKTAKVTKATDIEPPLINLPRESRPTFKAIWLAYAKFWKYNIRPSRANFQM